MIFNLYSFLVFIKELKFHGLDLVCQPREKFVNYHITNLVFFKVLTINM
jgi:hypothetical protein